MSGKFVLWVRRKVEVNTDPQRRCYNGCHAKSELRWTEWEDLFGHRTMEDAEDSKKVFQAINPSRQYKITVKDL